MRGEETAQPLAENRTTKPDSKPGSVPTSTISTTMPSFIYGHTRSPRPPGKVELGERCMTALRADLSRFVGEAI